MGPTEQHTSTKVQFNPEQLTHPHLLFSIGLFGVLCILGANSAPPGQNGDEALYNVNHKTGLETEMLERQKKCDYCKSIGILFVTPLEEIPDGFPVFAIGTPDPSDDGPTTEDEYPNYEEDPVEGDFEWVRLPNEAQYSTYSKSILSDDETINEREEKFKNQCCGQKHGTKDCCGQVNGEHKSCCGNRKLNQRLGKTSVIMADETSKKIETPQKKDGCCGHKLGEDIVQNNLQSCCGNRKKRAINQKLSEDPSSFVKSDNADDINKTDIIYERECCGQIHEADTKKHQPCCGNRNKNNLKEKLLDATSPAIPNSNLSDSNISREMFIVILRKPSNKNNLNETLLEVTSTAAPNSDSPNPTKTRKRVMIMRKNKPWNKNNLQETLLEATSTAAPNSDLPNPTKNRKRVVIMHKKKPSNKNNLNGTLLGTTSTAAPNSDLSDSNKNRKRVFILLKRKPLNKNNLKETLLDTTSTASPNSDLPNPTVTRKREMITRKNKPWNKNNLKETLPDATSTAAPNSDLPNPTKTRKIFIMHKKKPFNPVHQFQVPQSLTEKKRFKRESCCGRIETGQTECCGQMTDYIEWSCCGREDGDVEDCCGQINSDMRRKRDTVNKTFETEGNKIFYKLQDHCSLLVDLKHKKGILSTSVNLVSVICVKDFDNFGCNSSFSEPSNCSALTTEIEMKNCCLQNFIYKFAESFETLFNLTFNGYNQETPARDPMDYIEVFPNIDPTME